MTDATPIHETPDDPARIRPRDVRRLAMQALYALDAAHPEATPGSEPRGPATPNNAREARAALRRKQGAGNGDQGSGRAESAANPLSDPRSPIPAAEPDPEALLEALEEPFDDGDAEVPLAPKLPAVELALAAWATRHEADAQCSKLAPDWPTSRQPPIDRAILRLAWFEMTTGRNPPAVVINEAVELAKQFSDEKSPPFINGVLDRIAKRLPDEVKRAAPGIAPRTGDAWLDDAVAD